MAETLRGGLSLGVSGFGFWSHDIGGFEETSPPDLYKRWVAFGLLSSHSRLHGSSSYRVPWLYDEDSVDVLRFFTKLKHRLMPYIYRTAIAASQTGLPMMRPMVLEFEEDPTCHHLDRQFMLGDSMLVAPIFNADGMANFYLPAGTWTHFLSGVEVEGGCWFREHYDYLSLPLFVTPNTLIPVGSDTSKPDYDYENEITFHAFAIRESEDLCYPIYDTQGVLQSEACLSATVDSMTFEVRNASKPWTLLLRNVTNVKDVQGASWSIEGNDTRIIPSTLLGPLNIALGK